ncbi:MAG: Mov34/MPN/PAD-1 family protein [Terracidiphilus sp.]
MGVLRLSRSVYEALRIHGEETYPYECCGVLLGRSTGGGWSVEAAARAGNARSDSARNRYEIAAAELVRIERGAREQGLEIAGFYHSHPDHPPEWSETDLAEAHWVGCVYVITEVKRGLAAATHSFLLAGTTEEDKRFEPETIELV